MHANEQLPPDLFRFLNAHDHDGIASCYDENAVFRDIAFTLNGKQQIHAMWEMICSDSETGKSDIVVKVQELSANDSVGRVVVVDDYTFRDTGRKVQSQIVSTFVFRDGKIFNQSDECDRVLWARQAFGGFSGIVAGRIGFFRRGKAMKKLRNASPHAFEVS